jgi:hypothetical protein
VLPVGLLVIVAFVAVVVVLGRRHNEVFLVSIRRGRVLLVRGAAPSGLLHDFAQVARDAGIRRGTLRAIRGDSHTRLFADGLDAALAQRFRNIVGLYPLSQLRAAAPVRRNLGQVMGWTFLAWFLLPPER